MTDINQEDLNDLGNEITDIIEKYGERLPPYEIGHQLIAQAACMLLCTAPNELVGIKTVLACVENGIGSYEETHS